ncbi:Non-canonical purine NTP pyrophosphatase [Anatilimnocola aggregata]|uniref:dITP/XTP pyrophosphatase n=1 Tax=Anatilimnocola aggregata TaxID=2528021 RepID=A0A517Y5Q8_9BACT|nr:non-canonical purine NTP pyrophosphatase [Anatilimnocola aggregata]QDU25573.1 Non-canonical purine NTP pyrophosphatase [Anatilimnocola aggregata]
MPDRKVLVMGTRNRKKLGELIDLLEPHGFELRSLADFPNSIEIDETGTTFAKNAALKATLQARHLGHWVLGEDSGLAVDFLKGAPGVYSARFSGEGATDESNNRLLLEKLAGVPLEKRGAHYVCHATLSDPSGQVVAETEDYCRGRILETAAGGGGFGYDPLFEVIECHKTFGELSPAVKSVLSHRSRAIRAIVLKILALVK